MGYVLAFFFKDRSLFFDMLYERDPKLHDILQPFDAEPAMPDPFAYNQQMTPEEIGGEGMRLMLLPVEGTPHRKTYTHEQKPFKTKNEAWTTRKKPGT
jgi:hypothetical protein